MKAARHEVMSKMTRHPCDHSESRSSSGPARGQRSPEDPAARRCRDTHAQTRSSAPSHAYPPARSRPAIPKGPTADDAEMCMVDAQLPLPARGQWSQLGPRPAVLLRTALCRSCVASARPAVPVGPASGGTWRSMRPGAGHAKSLMMYCIRLDCPVLPMVAPN